VLGERRCSGETKDHLANLPPDTPPKTPAATTKAGWACEQAHRQLKEEPGLDHHEGRSWTGLHRYARMTMMAYAFLQHCRLTAAGRGKGPPGHPLSTACPPSAPPSSVSCCTHVHRRAALTAATASAPSE
jgi:hypothetical protein